MLAFFRARCLKPGYCLRDKAIKDFLSHYNEMESKRHMKPGTAKTYLRGILKSGFALEIKAVNGRDYLIASESPTRMREVMEGFRSDLQEEADYKSELCRAQAEKAAQDQEAWAELLAYARGENVEPADDEDAKPAESADFFAGESENFVDAEESLRGNVGNFADNAENNAEEPAKFYQDDGKVLRPNESNLGGESSYESSLQLTFEFTVTTTTPSSTLPRVVEESMRGNVILVDDNLGEQEKSQEEVLPGNDDSSLSPASEEDNDRDFCDPFAEDSDKELPTSASKAVLEQVPAPASPSETPPSAGGFDLTEEEQIFEDDPLGAAVPAPVSLSQEALLKELISEGMGEARAKAAVRDRYDAAVMQLENLRRALPTEVLKPSSRGAWLNVAIRDGYGPTKGYTKHLAAQKAEQERQEVLAREEAARQAQNESERILFDEFEANLSETEYAALRQRARNCVHPDWRKRGEAKCALMIAENYKSLLRGDEITEHCFWAVPDAEPQTEEEASS